MRIKNSVDRYGIVTISFHWLIAVLIIALLALGIYMTNLSISLQKLKLYGWHKEYGILVLLLAIMRMAWRFANITPLLPDTMAPWEKLAARSVHFLFYFFMFAMPLTGWLISSAAGLSVSFFGIFVLPDLVSANSVLEHFFQFTHRWLGYALIALISAHIFAALQHHFFYKDDILRRILP